MKGQTVMRVLLVAVLAALLMAVAGCGSSGPTAAVEDFMKATQDKNCQKMIDAMDFKAAEEAGIPNLKDELVKACEEEKDSGGELVSYKILEETINGDSATVKVEATTKNNDQEKTESTTLNLVQRDGKWLISSF